MVTETVSTNTNTAKEEDATYNHVPWPVRPSTGINYDFIVSMYFGGCALALIFFTAEKRLLAPLLDQDSIAIDVDTVDEGEGTDEEVDPWKEFAKGMQGMYFVFAPFLLCLPWSLIVRHYWMRETIKVD